MAAQVFCTQGDLEIGLGGADVLRQLADPTGAGAIDSDIVTDYIESGAAEIRSAAEIKHDPEALAALDADSSRRLRDANVALSSRIAYEKGGRGMAMPEWVESRAQRSERFLEQLATGARRLGRVSNGTQASINQPAEVEDFDSQGLGISITSFKLGGFR